MEFIPAVWGPVSCSFTVRLSAGSIKNRLLVFLNSKHKNLRRRVSAHRSSPRRGRECELPSLQVESYKHTSEVDGETVRSGCDIFLCASSPVCRSSGDAAAWRRHQHRVSLLGQADPLLHQPSFTLDVLLRLFCSQRKAGLLSTTLIASLQLRGG